MLRLTRAWRPRGLRQDLAGNNAAPGAVPPSVPDADHDTGPSTVTFFWRPGCGFCTRLRRDLLEAGVELDERNIWDDPDAAAFVRSVARGNETVPTVVAGGRALVNPPAHVVVALLG